MATKGALMEAAERKRFLDTIRDDKEFAALVRQELGLAGVSDLPNQVMTLTATVNKLAENVERLAATVDRMGDRLDRHLERFNTDFGEIKGGLLEKELEAHPQLALMRLGPEVRSLRALNDQEVLDLLFELDLTGPDAVRLSETDLVAVIPGPDGSPASYIVVEASWRTGSEDVERVVASREIVSRTGVPVVAVVFDQVGLAHPSVERQIQANDVTHLSRAA